MLNTIELNFTDRGIAMKQEDFHKLENRARTMDRTRKQSREEFLNHMGILFKKTLLLSKPIFDIFLEKEDPVKK